jgi:hypothetical protein
MNLFEFDATVDGHMPHQDSVESYLEIEGSEGSTLRATHEGLTVCPHGGPSPVGVDRRWAYDQLHAVGLDAYPPVGVIRATVRTTGATLPLLILEPEQIPAARRTLEIIWNLMAATKNGRQSA